MKEQLISFETAKLAKEKEFDYFGNIYYESPSCRKHRHHKTFTQNGLKDCECLAPTQSLLQKWLREKHFLELAIDPNILGYGYRCGIWDTKIPELVDRTEFLKTYERSLEAGLQEALKLI